MATNTSPAAAHGHNAEHVTSPATEALVRFAATRQFADLPAEVVRESKRCILDYIGVAIGAADTDAVEIAHATVQELGGAPQARALVFGDRTSVTNAALLNGILSHVLDFDDTHIPTILHPTGPVMSAAFPVGEWRKVSGKDLIAAHALAFEVEARASLALYPEHYDRGWHMTGTTGTLGAAVAAGRLLGLDEVKLRHAIGIAATQSSGHREQFGAMTKSWHSGKAAMNGTLAALLASRGYTAAADSLEGRRGMFYVMSTKGDADELTVGLGEQWEIFRNGFKPYSCGVVTHPGIDAVRRLGSVHGVKPAEVESIDLRVHPLVLELTGKTEPQTGLEGKFSIGFASAIALIEGTARQRQFTDEKVVRPDVVALLQRVHPVADTSLSHTEAVATGRLKDGRSITEHVTAATGTPENPISDAELREKFLDLVEPVLGIPAGERIAELVARLETLPDVSEIVTATLRG
jgi:2-methylcitrate dehydratase PrpD